MQRHLPLLAGRSGSIIAFSVDHPSECASVTIAGGPHQGSAPVGARAFVQDFFFAHAVRARSSDGHKNVLSLIGYSHILENR